MARLDGRGALDPRQVQIETGFQRNAEGSVLYRAGGTVVLATASCSAGAPPWMNGRPGGWITAEYAMHPRANPSRRQDRDSRKGPPKARSLEIQRLIGRALRAAVNLPQLDACTITIDCDILEADGGTRTASVTAGYMALALALQRLDKIHCLIEQVAAISVGLVGGHLLVDLDYPEDSNAAMDMNVVASRDGAVVEVQATAEDRPIPGADFDRLLQAALGGVAQLCTIQSQALAGAGIALDGLGQ